MDLNKINMITFVLGFFTQKVQG